MFKLPYLPSPGAGTHELADFAELLCWSTGVTSAQAIIRYLGRNEGNESQKRGCEDSDDDNSAKLDEVMDEISLRAKACDGGYPFQRSRIVELSGELDPKLLRRVQRWTKSAFQSVKSDMITPKISI